MADEKPKSPAPAAPERDLFREGVEIIVALLVLAAVYNSVTTFFHRDPLFQHGLSGLTPHGIVLDYTRPIASLFNPVGANIIATDDPTSVLDDAGGLVIGTQPFGAPGQILEGPVQVGGVNYYDVDFQKNTAANPDGWVAEQRIAYQDSQPTPLARAFLWFWKFVTYIKYALWLISIGLVVGLIYIIRKLTALRVNNRERLYPTLALEAVPEVNPKWQRVTAHVESANENDWRLAIIEADIMLSELLDTMHLQGDSIGDKLKGVEKSDFTTLDAAWEAHKIRNQIAHSGSDYLLNQREARRVIGLYEAVFKEFQFI